MGAPLRNRNSLRHGLTAVGQLPQGCQFVARHVNRFRRAVEDAVLGVRETITVFDAGCISTACRWEKYALLATRWLAEAYSDLSVETRMKYAADTARASEARDRALARLGIDSKAQGSGLFSGVDAQLEQERQARWAGDDEANQEDAPDEDGEREGDDSWE